MKPFQYILQDLNLTRESQGEHSYLFMLLTLLNANQEILVTANSLIDDSVTENDVFGDAFDLAGDAQTAAGSVTSNVSTLGGNYDDVVTASGDVRTAAGLVGEGGGAAVIAALDIFDAAVTAADAALAAVVIEAGLDNALTDLADALDDSDYDLAVTKLAAAQAYLPALLAANAAYQTLRVAVGTALTAVGTEVTSLDDGDTTTAYGVLNTAVGTVNTNSVSLASAVSSLAGDDNLLSQIAVKLTTIASLRAVDAAIEPTFTNPYAEAMRHLESFRDTVAYRSIAALFASRIARYVEPPQ